MQKNIFHNVRLVTDIDENTVSLKDVSKADVVITKEGKVVKNRYGNIYISHRNLNITD